MNKLRRNRPDNIESMHSNALCTVLCRQALFTPEECRRIISESGEAGLQQGTIGGVKDKQENVRVRKSDIRFCFPDEQNRWIFDRLEDEVHKANQTYGFEIDGFFEGFQIARYAAGGHYTWHMDIGNAGLSLRKLSMTVQLSDAGDYTGGDLKHIVATRPASREIGSLTIFPSYLLHVVDPVLSGVRYSLVAWVSGTPFR